MIPYVYPFGWSVHFKGGSVKNETVGVGGYRFMKDQEWDAKGFGLYPEEDQEYMNHFRKE